VTISGHNLRVERVTKRRIVTVLVRKLEEGDGVRNAS
jgi:hypothetical protein